MKKTIALLLAFWCFTSMAQQSLHSLTIKNIDGANINMATYQDSNLLVICIAPISPNAINQLKDIDSLMTKYGSKIKLVGVMSIEDGYVDSNKTAIKSLYSSLGINILLTEGMYTKKSAGTNQSVLLNWLTSKTLNQRFNIDVKGIGQKFFVDKYGKLYGILPPEVPFIAPITENYLNRKP